MPKKSENKAGPSKNKANASPFHIGSNGVKPKSTKAPATTKLNAVSDDKFYGDKTRAGAKASAAKAKAPLNPRDFPSPTDHSLPLPRLSKRNAQADEDVIEVDEGESEEEIEEVVEPSAAPPVHNGRASMTIAGSSNRRIEKTSIVASKQSQMWTDAETKLQAKSRDMSVKGKAVSDCVIGVNDEWLLIRSHVQKETLHQRGQQKVLFSDVRELHINGHQVNEKDARGLLLHPENSKLKLQHRDPDNDKGDLEIPIEASIQYVRGLTL
jgi:hypothetical protein